jgi:hypothetical protein
MSAYQYAIARRKALYLPESYFLLMYVACLLAVDTMWGINIDECTFMIVDGLENTMRNFSSIRAFLPSECQ